MTEKIAEGLKPLLTDIKSIKIDPRNARKHPVRNLDAIKLSLETYGQRKPIVVNAQNDTVEAGNGLYLAAVDLGWTQIAVVYVNDDEITSKAYGLMDNQSALISEWDLPVLKDLLTELDTGDLDMNVTGFSADEIEGLMTAVHLEGTTEGDNQEPHDICKCPKCGFEFAK
jgi:ParB-like chromosome segregation protein Spo0J